MGNKQTAIFAAVALSCVGAWCFAETLDVKGDFSAASDSDTIPSGWFPNKPANWDDEGGVSLNKLPDSQKNSLRLTPRSKAMHVFFGKQWPVSEGDKCVIKAMVKGKGECVIGIYAYPAGAFIPKSFELKDEWTECVAEISVAKMAPAIDKLSIVLSVNPGSWAEFKDVSAEIIKKQ